MSILESIKALLGLIVTDTAFDTELIMHINSALSKLTQLGVGPSAGFKILGTSESWNYLLTQGDIENVKMLVYLHVRLSFDPPQNSFLVKSIEDQIKELEWRIEVAVDPHD